MQFDNIQVKGAREHNLKDIDVEVPRNKLVVITGVSGSGKSSLAFDTIYAEGQRRYMESLSAYARQFLGRMEKPDVDSIEGLSPAISIDQKGASHNPRSTVGTVTEVYDFLRLLFARIGHPHCPKCSRPVQKQTLQEIVDAIQALPAGNRLTVLAPIVRDRKGEFKDVFKEARSKGFVRVRVDGQIQELADIAPSLDKRKRHTVDIVVDRLVTGGGMEEIRIYNSVETAMRMAGGIVVLSVLSPKHPDISATISSSKMAKGLGAEKAALSVQELMFSEHFSCPYDGVNIGEIEPRTFSFNSPHGACQTCTGLGFKFEVDPDLVIPNRDLSLKEGAVIPWVRSGTSSTRYNSLLESLAESYGFSTKVSVSELPEWVVQLILYGDRNHFFTMRHRTQRGKVYTWDTTFEGVIPNLTRRYRATESEYVRSEIERVMARRPCVVCGGRRLKPESLAVTVCGSSITDVCSLTIERAVRWLHDIQAGNAKLTANDEGLTERDRKIARQILKEIETRLMFMLNVGLNYLTLDRTASTLSGGEAQRIRLATQIGSGLMGVLYVCDEPSIGLHPADDHRLIETLKNLRDLGNTVLIVEHDEAIMRSADHIIDLGPGAGEHGGHLVASGTPRDVMANPDSLTGAYLAGRRLIPIPSNRRLGNGESVQVVGARANNLKNIAARFPLGMLVVVTGVSGSGKSTLVSEVLHRRIAQLFYRAKDKPGEHDTLVGTEYIDKVVNIDQSPIGRTPRSNPATYTGLFSPVRELFSQLPEARVRGYRPGRFSFNVRGGRCESCAGAGYIQIEMQFLPDVMVACEVCLGARYDREVLEVKFREHSIAEVLNMTVDEALELFSNLPRIRAKLQTMKDVGLGYIKLGQPATTLSGGEAQRVKLSSELSRRATGRTLYILDEPTTGLSFEDTAALLRVLHRLADAGNSIIVIEHHLDVIKNADWLLDLGPGAGEEGGWIIAEGTPEQVAETVGSSTGEYLRPLLTRISSRKCEA